MKISGTTMPNSVSPIEQDALRWLHRESSILITQIPDKTEVDVVFRDRTPGLPTFKRLEKAGLCYVTEEDPMFPEDGPDGPTWTPSVEITDLGRAWDPSIHPSVFPMLPERPAGPLVAETTQAKEASLPRHRVRP